MPQELRSWIQSNRIISRRYTTLQVTCNFYKPHNDLNIYKKFELEWTFVEIINLKKPMLVWYIYILLWMLRISIKIVNILLDEISKEEENIFLLGDFNISFLNYNDRNLQMISLTHLHPTLVSLIYSNQLDLLVLQDSYWWYLFTWNNILHHMK